MERNDPARQADIEFQIARMDWEGPAMPGTNPEGRVSDERHPSTHPLRKGRTRFETDPTLRGAEELAMVTGRIERLDQPR